MQKNLPWVISFIFFAVAVAALLTPYIEKAPPPLLSQEQFNAEADKIFAQPGFELDYYDREGSNRLGFYRYTAIYRVNDEQFANYDLDPLERKLIKTMEPQNRAGGNYLALWMTSPDRFVSLAVHTLPENHYQLVYLEVAR